MDIEKEGKNQMRNGEELKRVDVRRIILVTIKKRNNIRSLAAKRLCRI